MSIFCHRSTKQCLGEALPVIKLREQSKNKNEFDMELEKLINLHSYKPEIDYPESEYNIKNTNNLAATLVFLNI